jgi:hypothetical protein
VHAARMDAPAADLADDVAGMLHEEVDVDNGAGLVTPGTWPIRTSQPSPASGTATRPGSNDQSVPASLAETAHSRAASRDGPSTSTMGGPSSREPSRSGQPRPLPCAPNHPSAASLRVAFARTPTAWDSPHPPSAFVCSPHGREPLAVVWDNCVLHYGTHSPRGICTAPANE